MTTQAQDLEKRKVQETLYLLFGQDYKEMSGRPTDDRRWHRAGKGRGYAAQDDEADDAWDEDDYPESVYYMVAMTGVGCSTTTLASLTMMTLMLKRATTRAMTSRILFPSM